MRHRLEIDCLELYIKLYNARFVDKSTVDWKIMRKARNKYL